MDRRQKKTRTAVFEAFSELLSAKHYHQITVGEIINRADIGRATFYAHFETKDFLLKELCEELFCHVFDCAKKDTAKHKHVFDCTAPDSVFVHLLQHLLKNDHHILDLLVCENNALFLNYFKENLKKLIEHEAAAFPDKKTYALPKDFWINHVSATFVETVRWWIEHGMKESPETLYNYFVATL